MERYFNSGTCVVCASENVRVERSNLVPPIAREIPEKWLLDEVGDVCKLCRDGGALVALVYHKPEWRALVALSFVGNELLREISNLVERVEQLERAEIARREGEG